MNKTLITILLVTLVVVLAGGIFFAGSMYARLNSFGLSMMSGYGWNRSNNEYGPGMMNRRGRSGTMNGGGQYGMGPNMMGGYYNTNASLTPLTVDQANAAAEKYLADLKNSDLQISEVMIFDNNAYVVVKENSTGNGAFELLVDPASQIAYPEHGPNMMWNLKYGGLSHQSMMSGRDSGMMGASGNMMNGWNNTTAAEMTVTPQQAIEYAQQYLDSNLSGATAASDPVQFYGYYTLDFEKDGKVAGMLSVNGYSRQVFLHTWHGAFIEESAVQ